MNEYLNYYFLDNPLSNYLWFLLIICLALILKKYISKLFSFLLYKLFRRFTLGNYAKEFNDLLIQPIGLFVVFLIVSIAFNILNYPKVLEITFYGFPLHIILKRVMQLIIILSFTWVWLRIIDFIHIILQRRAERTDSKLDDQLVPFIKDFLKVGVVIIAFFFILSGVFAFNITSLLAGLGIGGLAVALAAKNSLENLIGSFTIFLDRPFTIGDTITLGGVTGTVEKVGFRSTRLRTFEKTTITLPNKLINDSITDNLTLRTFRRVSFSIGLTYNTSAEQMKAVVADIQQYLDEHKNTNQESSVTFHEFMDSSLSILIQYFVEFLEFNEFLKLREEINFKVMEIVKHHNASFAFPSRSVYLERDDSLNKS